VAGTAALQLCPSCDQGSTAALQAVEANEEQLAACGRLHAPLLQAKTADPTQGAWESRAVTLSPEAAAAALPVHSRPPTVHLKLWGVHGRAGGGSVQTASLASVHWPAMQLNRALPTPGPCVSSKSTLDPVSVVPAVAWQEAEPTDQVSKAAEQGAGGTAQLAELGALQTPPRQVKLAAPTAGSSESVAV
jgi:hypothetical protein